MKFIAIILFLSSNILFAQKITTVLQGSESDSSFYHLTKINENEYWAGGEYGILKKIDTVGNTSDIEGYQNEGFNILVIERVGDYVYITTDDAVIYRYNLLSKTMEKKCFSKFKNRCFYDLKVWNNQIYVCGGTTGIADGLKRIPHGFIGILNFENGTIDIVWRNIKKFAWSMDIANDNLIVSMFNGINTDIKSLNSKNKLKKEFKIKGLVHEIQFDGNMMSYCGTKNIHYTRTGIYGLALQGFKKHIYYSDDGCYWSIEFKNKTPYIVTNSGKLLSIEHNVVNELKIPTAFTLYDLELISENKLLIVGHGKGIYIVHL